MRRRTEEYFDHFAWLHPLPLPGGAAAIRQPWRTALSALYHAYGREILQLKLPSMEPLTTESVNMIVQMIDKKLNAPLTSSCGRLFDAIAAMLNIRTEINYEAQAAIELEMAADESVHENYQSAVWPGELPGALAVAPLIRCVVEDLRSKVPTSTISARFHRTLAELFVQTAVTARAKRGIDRVGLSGGVFQNQYFLIDEEEAKKTYEVWEGLVEAAAEEGTDIFGMPLQEDGKDSDKTTPKP